MWNVKRIKKIENKHKKFMEKVWKLIEHLGTGIKSMKLKGT